MKITLVTNNDDWEGIYFDGVLMLEDHQLRPYDILYLVQQSQAVVEDVVKLGVDDEWLYERGRLPKNLEDVVFENNA